MASGAKIKGAKELQRKLEALAKAGAVRVNRRAVNLATTPMLSATKAAVSVHHGDLKRSLIKKIANKGGNSTGIVGADANYVVADGEGHDHDRLKDTSKEALDSLRKAGADLTRPSKYDHLVELGHMGPGGVSVPAYPFLRPGFDNSVAASQAKYEKELADGIEKEASKGA